MLIDTHAHLDQDAFDADRTEVIRRAVDAGVEHVVAIGVTADSSEACVRLAEEHGPVSAAVGIQPNDVAEAKPGDWDRIVELAQRPGVVALGETGLDRHWDFTPFDQQQDYFDRHLRLSQQTGLPFIVHMRDCGEDVLQMLQEARERGPLHGVMHSYTGDAALAEACLALGLDISFAGMVTFKKSNELRAVAQSIPIDRLLVETDCPYLSPEPVRKIRRNEPAHVAHTARLLADACGVPFDDLARQTTANAKRLFRLA
ncbi:putative deoxyribonuclease YcfH [Posidoniimonas corsicana]|uniref:Putative deoxyribonuclease YcfH n=1 Tax=Posidoniimonas corsicana TaxID=1938618 RepID=A0A5C5VIH0_9BACT|nr:TatD family hydrolase [Posidoniimonas corsicana]TWT37669.1 putative deoxyribonuclease YcfH [Posidoniimonas corsicana]